MKVKVYNLDGKESKELELNEAIFNVKIKPAVVHEVFVIQSGNQREPWADTKNRGEVSGGGRKPWRQKGTGRARHGSIRSPIWKGGGVTFGPLSIENYSRKVNKATRRLATKMCLSDKALNNSLVVSESFEFSEKKTKLFAGFLKKLPAQFKRYLVLTGENEKELYKQTRNLAKVVTMPAADVNVMELVENEAVVVSMDGLKTLEKVFAKK